MTIYQSIGLKLYGVVDLSRLCRTTVRYLAGSLLVPNYCRRRYPLIVIFSNNFQEL